MKKYIIFVLLSFMLVGCSKNIDTSIGNLSDLDKTLVNYENNWEYPFINTYLSYNNGFSKSYNLYKDYITANNNYSEYKPILSMEIECSEIKENSEIKKITYTIFDYKTLSESSYEYIYELIEDSFLQILEDVDEIKFEKLLFNSLSFPKYQNFNDSKSEEKYIIINGNKKNKIEAMWENSNIILTYKSET